MYPNNFLFTSKLHHGSTARVYNKTMRKKIDIVLLLIVISVGVVAAFNAQAIGDWYHDKRYSPPQKIEELANSASMTELSKKLFYRFSPQLLSQTELNSKCGDHNLGCSVDNSIYILKYSNNKEFNQSTVTAAHEMLHIAYSRLSESEKTKVCTLLDGELKKSSANKVLEKIGKYPAGEFCNEAHSFVGTELTHIGTGLSEYYDKYFINRSELTRAYALSPIN